MAPFTLSAAPFTCSLSTAFSCLLLGITKSTHDGERRSYPAGRRASVCAQRDLGDPAHADGSRGCRAEINYTTLHERSSVIDTYDHRAPGMVICHAHFRAEGKARMRGRECARVH